MNLFWRKNPGLGTFLALLLAALSFKGARAGEDKVTLYKLDKSGQPEVVTGHIKQEDMNGIVVSQNMPGGGTADRTFKPEEIASIDWAMEEPAYAQDWNDAVSAFKAGNYGQAGRNFALIKDDAENLKKFENGRPEAKACLFFMYAESLFRGQKTAEAVKAFESFMNDFKNSMYAAQAVGSMVEAAIVTGDAGKVQPLLAVLRARGGEQKATADFYEGKLRQSKKEYAQAAKNFSEAYQGSNSQKIKGMALMGQAECAVAEGKPAEAKEKAQKALSSNPPASVAAAAHLVIGEALLAEVEAQKLAGEALENGLVDAVLEFLRVSILYGGDRATEPEALFRAGDCFLRLSKKFASRAYDRQRAASLFSKLKDDPRWQGTEWANKANEELQKLR